MTRLYSRIVLLWVIRVTDDTYKLVVVTETNVYVSMHTRLLASSNTSSCACVRVYYVMNQWINEYFLVSHVYDINFDFWIWCSAYCSRTKVKKKTDKVKCIKGCGGWKLKFTYSGTMVKKTRLRDVVILRDILWKNSQIVQNMAIKLECHLKHTWVKRKVR